MSTTCRSTGPDGAAAQQAGVSDLVVTVADDFAASRQRFIGATIAENLDRADFNPLEEAEQITVLVEEVGTQTAAAEQLRARQRG